MTSSCASGWPCGDNTIESTAIAELLLDRFRPFNRRWRFEEVSGVFEQRDNDRRIHEVAVQLQNRCFSGERTRPQNFAAASAGFVVKDAKQCHNMERLLCPDGGCNGLLPRQPVDFRKLIEPLLEQLIGFSIGQFLGPKGVVVILPAAAHQFEALTIANVGNELRWLRRRVRAIVGRILGHTFPFPIEVDIVPAGGEEQAGGNDGWFVTPHDEVTSKLRWQIISINQPDFGVYPRADANGISVFRCDAREGAPCARVSQLGGDARMKLFQDRDGLRSVQTPHVSEVGPLPVAK